MQKVLDRKLMISNCKLCEINKGVSLRITFEHFLFYRTLSTTRNGVNVFIYSVDYIVHHLKDVTLVLFY